MNRKLIGIFIVMLLIGTVFPALGTTNTVMKYKSTNYEGIDWWEMAHHDSCNSGYSTSKAPNTNNVLWIYTAEDFVRTSPAIVDNKVYFGTGISFYSEADSMLCLDAETGEEIWKLYFNSGMTSSPAVFDKKVYFGADKGVYCVNADDGDILWIYETSDYNKDMVVFSNKVYVQLNDGMYCLNATTGEKIWNDNESSGYSVPAVADGRVFVVAYIDMPEYNCGLLCLDAETGERIWICGYHGNAQAIPSVVNNKVFFKGDAGSTIWCLDATTGETIWVTDNLGCGGNDYGLAVANNKVFCGFPNFDGSGTFYCLDADTGNMLWSFDTNYHISSAPVVADDKVYIGANEVYCLFVENGRELWNFTINEGIHTAGIANGKLYLGTDIRKIFCFGDSESNNPPLKPATPSGRTFVRTGKEYTYSTSTTDPDGNQVYYNWDFGDNVSGWIGPYNSGEQCEIEHQWLNQGEYAVKVKAKDEYYKESEWSNPLPITMPKTKIFNQMPRIISWLFERFPFLQPYFYDFI